MNNVICLLLSVAYMQVLQCTTVRPHQNLRKIIVGRCLEYTSVKDLNRHDDFKVSVDCGKVWEKFSKAFRNKSICSVTPNDYDGLFGLWPNTTKSNKILFWSGTVKIAHHVSSVNDDLVTLEDTFPGYIANDLRWCGCEIGSRNCVDGINNGSCDATCSDGRGTRVNKPYWLRASIALAEKANGTAYVIVNGTTNEKQTAYYENSIFGKYELPTLGKLKQVKKLEILVVHHPHRAIKEICVNATLVDLVNAAEGYGINTTCTENPEVVLGILCAKYPRAEECKQIKRECAKEPPASRSLSKISIVFIILFAIFLTCTILLGMLLLYKECRRPAQSFTVPNSDPESELPLKDVAQA